MSHDIDGPVPQRKLRRLALKSSAQFTENISGCNNCPTSAKQVCSERERGQSCGKLWVKRLPDARRTCPHFSNLFARDSTTATNE